MDSDDAYYLNYIASMMIIMNREKSDIVICKYSVHHTIEKMNPNRKCSTYPSIKEGKYNRKTALSALADNTINHSVWNKLYKKHLWADIRFPKGFVYEDVDTTFRIINLCTEVSVLDQVLYLYRKRSGSILDARSMKNNYDWVLAHDHYESFIISNTPTIFTEEQLKRKKLVWGKELLYWYGYLTWKKKEEWLKSSNYLREQILKVGNTPGYYALPTIVGYWIIYYCPLIYRISFPALLFLHRFIKRLLCEPIIGGRKGYYLDISQL